LGEIAKVHDAHKDQETIVILKGLQLFQVQEQKVGDDQKHGHGHQDGQADVPGIPAGDGLENAIGAGLKVGSSSGSASTPLLPLQILAGRGLGSKSISSIATALPTTHLSGEQEQGKHLDGREAGEQGHPQPEARGHRVLGHQEQGHRDAQVHGNAHKDVYIGVIAWCGQGRRSLRLVLGPKSMGLRSEIPLQLTRLEVQTEFSEWWLHQVAPLRPGIIPDAAYQLEIRLLAQLLQTGGQGIGHLGGAGGHQQGRRWWLHGQW